jgi:hypothetical protein
MAEISRLFLGASISRWERQMTLFILRALRRVPLVVLVKQKRIDVSRDHQKEGDSSMRGITVSLCDRMVKIQASRFLHPGTKVPESFTPSLSD